MKELSASVTVEAAFVVPVVVLLLMLVMQTGISLYTETKTAAQDFIEAEEWDAAKAFRRKEIIAEKLRK